MAIPVAVPWSMSGVLALARSLGTPTAASPVGGLGAAADELASGTGTAALAEAITRALGRTRPESVSAARAEAVRRSAAEHLEGYDRALG